MYNLIKAITSKSDDAKSIFENLIQERIQEQLEFKRIEIGAMMMEDMDANGVIQLSPQQKRAQKAKKDHSDAVADQDDKDGNGAESDDDSDDSSDSDSNDSSDNKQPPQFQKKDDSQDDEEESGDIADAKDAPPKKKNPFIKEAFARFRSSSSGRSSLKTAGYPSSRSRRDVDRDDEGWARTAKADAEFNKKTSPYPKSVK